MKENVSVNNIASTFKAVYDLNELFIQGQSKLDIEYASAQKIPQDRRYIINMNYLEKIESQGDLGKPGVVAEKYDKGYKYYQIG